MRALASAVELTPWAHADALMLGCGGYAPLRGFMTEAEYLSTLRTARLPDGSPWGLPVVFPVHSLDSLPDTLELLWQGQRLGQLQVTGAFALRPDEELDLVYGTRDSGHPSVNLLRNRPKYALSGDVQLDQPGPHSPASVKADLEAESWQTVAGFQTRNALHRGHEKLLEYALGITDGLLLHPLTGPTKADDLSARVRMASYEVSLKALPSGRVLLRPYPAAMRYAGPREALTHAVSRRNYGVTHFLIGRDHAGVGSYYAPDAAQKFLQSFTEAELGVKLLPMPEVVYCRACDDAVLKGRCRHGEASQQPISGSAIRRELAAGNVSDTVFREEVARTIREADPDLGPAR